MRRERLLADSSKLFDLFVRLSRNALPFLERQFTRSGNVAQMPLLFLGRILHGGHYDVFPFTPVRAVCKRNGRYEFVFTPVNMTARRRKGREADCQSRRRRKVEQTLGKVQVLKG